MLKQRIGLIGAGQMAAALAKGILQAGLASAQQLQASDPLETARKHFMSATGAGAIADNREVARNAEIVLLAIKPQQMSDAAAELAGRLDGKLVISIVAGVRLATLAEQLGSDARLVRVMPNTPCLIGQGACGFALGPGSTADDAQLVEQILAAVGTAYQVEEKLLDAVTGLSGSGPAFVYVMIEALSDGGVRMGLPRSVATALAARTVQGAAALALATGEHPGVLKDRVASPGGTTIAGLQALEAGGIRAALMAAVEAATKRSIELGKGPNP